MDVFSILDLKMFMSNKQTEFNILAHEYNYTLKILESALMT